MEIMKHDIPLRTVKLCNAFLMTLVFAGCWYGYYAQCAVRLFYEKGNWLLMVLFLILYITYGKVYDAFLVSLYRISEMVYSQCLAVLITDSIMYVITWMLSMQLPEILPLLITFAIQLMVSILWSVLAHRWYFASYPPKKTVIIYDTRKGMDALISEYGLEKKFTIQKTVKIEECLKNIGMLDKFETVFLSGIHSHERNIILKHCIEKGITMYLIPRVGDVLMSSARQMHMFHLPILRVNRYNPSPEYLFLKRTMDVVASGIALVIFSPIMLMTAIAIKVTDGGPVFYKQLRLTKDGKTFNVLKFRSMRVDAEKDGIARLSSGPTDDRITPVGRFIRKVRIDEIPQLLNILAGDMTIVGPRPERPQIAAQYVEEMPEFNLRLQAKAGLTGYAQVYGKYNTTPYDKLQMDLMYISNPSLVEDLRIIFATIKILFIPESTEGISAGKETAL